MDRYDDFYRRLSQAETGGEQDPWIRTKYKKAEGGSSAYGEVQITRGLAEGVLNQAKKFKLDDQDVKFLKKMISQQDLMLKYGGKDMVKGMERYDYGGKADFTEDDIPQYRRTVRKITDSLVDKYGGDLQQARREWRWGYDKMQDLNNFDEDYYKRFNR